MDGTFHKIDVSTWTRRDEYTFFSEGGCGFTMTADIDATGFHTFAKARGIKFYPLLVAATARILNAHTEFKYGWRGDDFGYYETVHPMFLDPTPDGSPKSLYSEYKSDLMEQVAEIERVRERYKDVVAYRPQGKAPPNIVNISCIPWVKFTGLSFCLQYCATYYPPIITFGRYEKHGEQIDIPLSVYCNHAVNDGYHCAMLINEIQALSEEFR